jgi:ketosteroid isomerase-like protein
VSQENVEIVRNCMELFNDQGVEAAVEAFAELLDVDFGIEEATDMPDSESYSGKDAFIANINKLAAEFDDLRIEPLEFVDLGEKLIVVVSMAGRGRASGAVVEMTFAQLWSIRAGKAINLRDFATKNDALKAMGLEE